MDKEQNIRVSFGLRGPDGMILEANSGNDVWLVAQEEAAYHAPSWYKNIQENTEASLSADGHEYRIGKHYLYNNSASDQTHSYYLVEHAPFTSNEQDMYGPQEQDQRFIVGNVHATIAPFVPTATERNYYLLEHLDKAPEEQNAAKERFQQANVLYYGGDPKILEKAEYEQFLNKLSGARGAGFTPTDFAMKTAIVGMVGYGLKGDLKDVKGVSDILLDVYKGNYASQRLGAAAMGMDLAASGSKLRKVAAKTYIASLGVSYLFLRQSTNAEQAEEALEEDPVKRAIYERGTEIGMWGTLGSTALADSAALSAAAVPGFGYAIAGSYALYNVERALRDKKTFMDKFGQSLDDWYCYANGVENDAERMVTAARLLFDKNYIPQSGLQTEEGLTEKDITFMRTISEDPDRSDAQKRVLLDGFVKARSIVAVKDGEAQLDQQALNTEQAGRYTYAQLDFNLQNPAIFDKQSILAQTLVQDEEFIDKETFTRLFKERSFATQSVTALLYEMHQYNPDVITSEKTTTIINAMGASYSRRFIPSFFGKPSLVQKHYSKTHEEEEALVIQHVLDQHLVVDKNGKQTAPLYDAKGNVLDDEAILSLVFEVMQSDDPSAYIHSHIVPSKQQETASFRNMVEAYEVDVTGSLADEAFMNTLDTHLNTGQQLNALNHMMHAANVHYKDYQAVYDGLGVLYQKSDTTMQPYVRQIAKNSKAHMHDMLISVEEAKTVLATEGSEAAARELTKTKDKTHYAYQLYERIAVNAVTRGESAAILDKLIVEDPVKQRLITEIVYRNNDGDMHKKIDQETAEDLENIVYALNQKQSDAMYLAYVERQLKETHPKYYKAYEAIAETINISPKDRAAIAGSLSTPVASDLTIKSQVGSWQHFSLAMEQLVKNDALAPEALENVQNAYTKVEYDRREESFYGRLYNRIDEVRQKAHNILEKAGIEPCCDEVNVDAAITATPDTSTEMHPMQHHWAK